MAGLLFGIDQPDGGTIDGRRRGRSSATRRSHSIGRGIALCPEDRKAEGIMDDLTVAREHRPGDPGRPRLAALSRAAAQYEIADEYIRLLNIATPTPTSWSGT